MVVINFHFFSVEFFPDVNLILAMNNKLKWQTNLFDALRLEVRFKVEINLNKTFMY